MEYLSADHPEYKAYSLVLPGLPQYEYKNSGWKGWNDWLGLNTEFKDYETTRRFVISLNLKSSRDWKNYSQAKRPQHLYAYPDIAYQNRGWRGWDHWLGLDSVTDRKSHPVPDIPEGARPCRCAGLNEHCTDCDGKGYYF
ncbi:MAG TPA: hypothetical protein PLJ84_07605 [Bacteroidales bacterium]|nr:hypothetical protein [Bacteroidales bacterium]HPT02450.1 hypothetical protein [Bacteroidales bacterium]